MQDYFDKDGCYLAQFVFFFIIFWQLKRKVQKSYLNNIDRMHYLDFCIIFSQKYEIFDTLSFIQWNNPATRLEWNIYRGLAV